MCVVVGWLLRLCVCRVLMVGVYVSLSAVFSRPFGANTQPMKMAAIYIISMVWIGLPSFLLYLLGSSLFSLLLAFLLFLLLPIGAAILAVGWSLKPPWHQPGTQPKNVNNRNANLDQLTSSDERSASIERAFEQSLGEEDDVGTLGLIVGAAQKHYNGRITNPLVDFQLPFKNITIHCRDAWRLRNDAEAAAATLAAAATSHTKKSSSNESDETKPFLSTTSINVASTPSEHYQLRGWYIPAERARTLVILVHGAARDRRTFMRHTPIFHSAGYSTLLIDCREHGTSSNLDRGIGFTTRESLDVVHAARYGKFQLGYEKIVLCGTSQGGASSIVATVLAEELILMDEPHVTGRRSRRNSKSHTSASSFPSSGPLISAVIAENPFLSREACLSDVFGHVLGRVPAWCIPIRVLRRIFILIGLMVLRWKLNLWPKSLRQLLSPETWIVQFQRANQGTEGIVFDQKRYVTPGVSPSRHANAPSVNHTTAAAVAVPSLASAHPLVSLNDFSPIDLMDRIAPRPILLMHGLADDMVKPIHSQILYAKARDPKKLWYNNTHTHTRVREPPFPS